MRNVIGIRREDKNIWERRAPLTPVQVKQLKKDYGIRFVVQHSEIRAFKNDEYLKAGAEVRDDICDCPVVLGIKEVPAESFQPRKTYLFFAHVIKGQRHNMAMLQHMMDLGCSLIDYERVTDNQGRRLIFFGRFAGIAGMVDTLAGLGKRLAALNLVTPFLNVKLAHEYGRVEIAKQAIAGIGERIRVDGLPERISPLVIGITGYGNVARGAQEVLNALGTTEVKPADLPLIVKNGNPRTVYQVVFQEEDMIEPKEPGHRFDLDEYFRVPKMYRSKFEKHLPYLSVLVNGIYWDNRYPRLVTKANLRQAFLHNRLRLLIIGDISCDIEGSIEPTVKVTNPGEPFFVYRPADERVTDGVDGDGVVIMAIDNLPCEMAIDSSQEFGQALLPFIPILAQTDFSKDADKLVLPGSLRRALILHKGKLTPDYQYIMSFIQKGK
ncbi:MAG: bifunctional lysine ketoglutarate reductase /saccharopine dehydrogenase family protein [bacterium]